MSDMALERTEASVRAEALGYLIDIAVEYGLEDLVAIIDREVEQLTAILTAALRPHEAHAAFRNAGARAEDT